MRLLWGRVDDATGNATVLVIELELVAIVHGLGLIIRRKEVDLRRRWVHRHVPIICLLLKLRCLLGQTESTIGLRTVVYHFTRILFLPYHSRDLVLRLGQSTSLLLLLAGE